MSSFAAFLRHSCDVARPSDTELPFGGASSEYDSDISEGVACRAETKRVRAYSDERGAWVTATKTVLLLLPATDVSEGDIVRNLTRDGVTDGRQYRVTGIVPHYGRAGGLHHKTAEIEAI